MKALQVHASDSVAVALADLQTSLVAPPNAGGVLIIGIGCENNQLVRLLEGRSMDDVENDRCKHLLEAASGKPDRNEENDYREIAIWKTGVTS